MTTPLSGGGALGNPSANNNPNASMPATNQPATPPTTTGTTHNPVQMADHGERYWLILQNIVEWLRFSEGKAGIILTSYGVLFTIIYTNAASVFSAINGKGEVCIISLVILFGIACLFSIYYAFMAIKPRLDNDGGNSILYFRNIKANYTDSAAYKAAAHTILDDESKYTDHLTEQIHTLSGIADRKYVFVGKAVWAFVISLAILVITVIIYVLKKLIAG